MLARRHFHVQCVPPPFRLRGFVLGDRDLDDLFLIHAAHEVRLARADGVVDGELAAVFVAVAQQEQAADHNTDVDVDVVGAAFFFHRRIRACGDAELVRDIRGDERGDDDKPHKVAVRVRNHPEYNIRARNEVTRKSPPREMTDRVVAALVTANVPNELGIAARANPPMKEKRGAYNVDVDVGVVIGRLLLLRDGVKYRGKFTVHYAVSASKADFVSGMDQEQVVEIPVSEYEAAKSKWWRHTLHMKMSPGEHHIAVGVLDGLAQRSGMAALEVDVK